MGDLQGGCANHLRLAKGWNRLSSVMWSAIIPYGEINFAEVIIALVPARQSSATEKSSPSLGTAAPRPTPALPGTDQPGRCAPGASVGHQDREGCTRWLGRALLLEGSCLVCLAVAS